MNRCFAIALSILPLTCGALAEPISVTEISVVDGDTVAAHGQRYRMIGYDTPEVVTPRRRVGPDERAVATIAKERFVELLGSGPLDLTEVRCSCSTKKLRDGTCNHHRKCAILSLNGKNIGDTLIAEELAVPYVCAATRCPLMPDWPRILERQMK
jgi:endonuclease YncB( thermonuclease family)